MEFRTNVDLPEGMPVITHANRLLLLGSCFAENIGQLLADYKFNCDVNPFGILYNPLSVAKALRQIIAGKVYFAGDLFFYEEQYHSYMHHGSFSATTSQAALGKINQRLNSAHSTFPQLDYLLITLGTSWVYEQSESGVVVSNCHKLPAKAFIRRRLSVQEVVAEYTELFQDILHLNPGLKVVLTVSPVRHLKDGLHENQLSKATLLLAIDQLCELFPGMVCYFPSYEIVTDELRDYRFYAEDMTHPSSTAIRYVWECFGEVFFPVGTRKVMKELEEVVKGIAHRPFNECSEEYKRFLRQIVLKIERIKEKYPYLDVEKELDICHTRLK